MPAKRELSMRQLRHLLRLHQGGVSAREIGRRLGVARSTIRDNLKRAAAAGLAWPLADNVTSSRAVEVGGQTCEEGSEHDKAAVGDRIAVAGAGSGGRA